jgi:hypothetical protein
VGGGLGARCPLPSLHFFHPHIRQRQRRALSPNTRLLPGSFRARTQPAAPPSGAAVLLFSSKSIREEMGDDDGESATDTWISWFCSQRGNEFFCEVDATFVGASGRAVGRRAAAHGSGAGAIRYWRVFPQTHSSPSSFARLTLSSYPLQRTPSTSTGCARRCPTSRSASRSSSMSRRAQVRPRVSARGVHSFGAPTPLSPRPPSSSRPQTRRASATPCTSTRGTCTGSSTRASS